MQYYKSIRNFINSEMFSDGLKTTFSIVIPPLILSFFNHIDIGVSIAFGVVLTHIVDIPGLLRDRRNFMLLSITCTFLISLFAKLIIDYNTIVLIALPLVIFSLSMLTVYGQRATNLSMSIMLAFIVALSNDNSHGNFSPLEQSFFIFIGGIWYMLVSLLISNFRPYRMAQQSLGECMEHVAEYIRLKTQLYSPDIDFESITQTLLKEQIIINEKQNLVREIVFRNKKLIKDTTVIGQSLVFIFSDLNDIFESINANHFNYKKMNQHFGNKLVFNEISEISNEISDELKTIAHHIITGTKPKTKVNYKDKLSLLKQEINTYKDEERIALMNVYLSLKHIIQKISFIHRFFYEKNVNEDKKSPYEHINKFIQGPSYTLKKIKDHLNFKSSIFRHALRLSIVMMIGYFLVFFLPDSDHSYWILLTILVIMKPGFSVTKKRNYQRILGTFFGGLLGVLIVYYVHQVHLKFFIMLIIMIFAYSYLRHVYVIGTLFLTAYILISLSFLAKYDTLMIIEERLLDTIIGGSLAFVSSYLLFPSWESKNVNETIQKALIANYEFLFQIFLYIVRYDINMTKYKLARKNVYINMANVTSIFQRVISEPKKTQINAKELNRFTIFNHTFLSYSIGLLNLLQRKENLTIRIEHLTLMGIILQELYLTILIFGEYKPKYQLMDLIKEFQKKEYHLDDIEIQNQADLIQELLELLQEIVHDLKKVSFKIKNN